MKSLQIFSVIAAFTLLTSALVQAQEERKNGIRAGYLFSNVSGYENPPSGLHGFYAGFYHDRPIGESGLLWGHGGTEYTQAGWMVLDNTYTRLHYISLPSALKVKLGPVFVQGGFALNFKVGEQVYLLGEDNKSDENKSRWFNFPLLAGAGLMVGPVTIEARYNYGLVHLRKDNDLTVGYLQLGAGIAF